MIDPEAPAVQNPPRVFWPITLSLAAVTAALLLLAPLHRMLVHGSTNYNEGWNAYHQQEAAEGKPLYGEPPRLSCNNYPPLSFHFIGLMSRLTGDVNQTGRWVALLSLALVAMLCGAIIRRSTGSAPLAVYTALNVVIWLTVFKADRVGMNDPQLLGTIFSVLGLYLYIREPDKLAWLSLSAVAFTVAVFTKHNLLAFPAAVGLHLFLRRKWKELAAWSGVGICGSALLLTLTLWLDGPYFFSHLLMPRTMTGWLTKVTDYAVLFQIPIAVAAIWLLSQLKRTPAHVVALALITSHTLAALFAGGHGADKNLFFDSILALVLAASLVFGECAPVVVGWRRPELALAALLIGPAVGVAIQVPMALRTDWREISSVRNRASDFDSAVRLLRSRPGPALCGDLLLCFEAGKPLSYDPFFADCIRRLGRVKEEELVSLVENTTFATVQLGLGEGQNLTPASRISFTTAFMEALLKHYRIEARLAESVILVPKNGASAVP